MDGIAELFETQGTFLALSARRGRGGMLKLRDGTRKSDELFNYSLESASNQPQVG